MKQAKLKRCVIAVALAVTAPQLVLAQQAAEPADAKKQVIRVVVTGSNLKRIDTETASPVQVLGRQEIEQSGAVTVAELLNNLTSNDHGALSDFGGTNSWASGATGVSLRNLGVGSTLVLLNGRRLSAYGFADGLQSNFVNIDTIPVDVIERVEILKDGASAIYGSDAVAGVINVITRKDFRRVSVKAVAQQSLERRFLGRERRASLTGGHGDYDADGYNVFGHLEVYTRGGYSDRAIRPLLPDWFIGQNPDRDALSTGSVPGNYVGRFPANYADKALAGKAINTAVPGCPPERLSGGLCFYDYWNDTLASPPAERAVFLGAGRFKISDSASAYGELQLAKTRNDYRTAPPRSNVNGVALTWFDSIKGEMQSFTDPRLPVGHPSNPYSFPIGLNYRFADHRELFKNVGASSQFRLLAGLAGTDYGWEWDAAVGHMGSMASQRQHLYRDRYAYADAITSGEYKFGQVNSVELILRMFPEMGSHGRFAESFVDFKASRELMQLDGGPLQVAAGLDLRHDSFEHQSSDNVLAARIVQFSGVQIDGARNTAAAFVELGAPLTKRFEASFAVRGDKVLKQAGAVVPKLGVKYKADDMLMLRATASQGFRAPSLPETGNGGASWFNNGVSDPKRCATAIELRDILNGGNAADRNMALTAYSVGCSMSFPAAITPNPGLKPEKSNIFMAGLVLQPWKAVSLTMDYYHIVRRNEITTRSIDETLDNEERVPGLVRRDPVTAQDNDLAQRAQELSGRTVKFATGPIGTLALQYQNIGKSKVSGVDLELSGRWRSSEWGSLNTALELNRQLQVRRWDGFANGYTENYVGFRGTPKVQAVAKLSWERGAVNAGLRANFTSASELAWGSLDALNTSAGCASRKVAPERCHIASDTTLDLWVKYKFSPATALSANVFNLLDRAAPQELRVGSGLPVRSRLLMVTLAHSF